MRTGCPYCGVGCGLRVGVGQGRVVKVNGDPQHPSSLGEVCMKAATLPATVHVEGRARRALVRASLATQPRETTVDAAIGFAADELRRIVAESGPDSIAFYGSGQLLTEDYYALTKLVKGFLGTDNLDTNSRLCMASAVAGYKRAFGADAPPGSYADLDEAEVILLIGANVAECHPILFRRIEKRVAADPDRVRVIVVDPRRTETADLAHAFLPIRPGSDAALLAAMLRLAVVEGHCDKEFIAAHTEGFDDAWRAAEPWTPEAAAEICGVPASAIIEVARVFARSRRAMVLWSMGINQSTRGTVTNHAILNLCLATGNVGRQGSGPLSLTGQPNAMGGREVGGLTGLLPGHRHIDCAEDRAWIARRWGLPAARIASRPGATATEMFRALDEGRIRAIWIAATNPAVSMPDLDRVHRALRRAELVVVQDAFYPTDTARFAHVFLPAATWPEKDGTMTNSERVVTRVRRAIDPPGDARADWELFALLAQKLGFGDAFAWRDASEVFDEYRFLTAKTTCDLSGIDHARLAEGPVAWPCPDPSHPGSPRRYEDGQFATPNGRARFFAAAPAPAAEPPSLAFPLVLTTGRLKPHWHTRTRTRWSRNLEGRAPEPVLQIHPRDARRVGLRDGDFAEVRSRRGEVVVQARVTAEIAEGTVFLPFHWGRGDGRLKAANNLTHDACDPLSKEPELKHCAVRVRSLPEPGLEG